MSLVEQTIARLKKQQAKPLVRARNDSSPHGIAPGPAVSPEDTANLGKRISIDNAALRARGYFPEQERDRQFADQYRRIKRPLVDRALAGSATVGEPRVIMVTSGLPGDGKTFTSINLALSMSLERDISVLLIDCDVAKRHVSEILGLGQEAGLLDVLLEDTLEPESVIVPTTTRGLSILPAGRQVAGTTELISSNRMRKIVSSLCARNSRRILLLDSPPLLVTNEGSALLKIAGQVVLVVRAEGTPKQAVQAALKLIDPQQAGGVVLNQVKGPTTEGYYGYGSYGTDAPEA